MTEIPFKDEITYVKNEIDGLSIEYLPEISKEIDVLFKWRGKLEENAFRITSIITMNYLYDSLKLDKSYFKTYMHDKLLDCVASYYLKHGYGTYKEYYISEIIDNKRIKGHCDLIIWNNKGESLVEIKNYEVGKVNSDQFLYFIQQILAYSKALNIKTVYLVINNPPEYKNLSVFKVNITSKLTEYITNFMKISLSIDDYKKTFKYHKVD